MAVALVSAIVLVAVGLIARMDDPHTATAEVHGPVLKVGKSMTVTTRNGSTIR
jgi:hypothetical protein